MEINKRQLEGVHNNLKRFSYTIWIVAMLFSCTTEDLEKPVEPDLIPILFAPEYVVSSRATDTDFENNDEIGVYIVKNDAAGTGEFKPSGNYADNYKYTYAGAGFACSPQLYYPTDGSGIDVYAYYPHISVGSADKIIFKVKENQAIEGNYTLSDLMLARKKGNTPTSGNIPLTFVHCMSKIVIELDEASTPKGEAVVTLCDVNTQIGIDFIKYTYSTNSTALVDVRACKVDNRTFKVLVPPQTVSEGSKYIKVTINGRDYYSSARYELNWEMGVEYNYPITF